MGLVIAQLNVAVAGTSVPVTVMSDLSDIAEWLSTRELIGLDTETTGLDPFTDDFRVRLIQLADLDEAIVIPVEMFDSRDLQRVGELIADHARAHRVCIHNADYDLMALDAVGICSLEQMRPEYVIDTRHMAYLLDPRPSGVGNSIGHGLKPLSDVWICSEASARGQLVLDDKAKEMGLSRGEFFAKVDLFDPDFLRYAALDSWLCRKLHDILRPHIVERGLERIEIFDGQVADILRKMRRFGLAVDSEFVESELIPFLENEEAAGRRDAMAYGVDNVFSTRQVTTALEAMGWVPLEFTPSGNPKCDKAVLTELAESGNMLASAVMRAKQAAKFNAAYAIPFLSTADANGRIHPEINPVGAITARMSMSKPPVQQLPSTGPLAHLIRKAIIAGEGKVYGSADYDQLELRVCGALAGEQSLIHAVKNGEDVYNTIAESIFGQSFTPADRKVSKVVALARIFGSGNATIAKQAGLSLEQATEVVRRYDDRFPAIRSFSSRLRDRATLGRREVLTPSGRRIPIELDAAYKVTNYITQSSSADVIKQSIVNLVYDGGFVPGEQVSLVVHDELLFISTPDDFNDHARTVESYMNHADFYGMPLTAKSEYVGHAWGDKYAPR